jgi:hypothetical protein
LTPSDRIKAVLLRVRELTANATPGEWVQQSDGWTVRARGSQEECAERGPMICSTNKPQVPTEQQVANSELIAESRTLLPRLAEALETMLNAVTERHRFMPSYEDPEYVGADGSHTVPAWCKDCGADWPCHYGLAVESVSALVSPGDSVEGE